MMNLLLLFCLLVGTPQLVKCNPPNIIVIVADDMGWNDVGFHGNNLLKTPNIDALAYNGVILNRHYVLPSCTPSRTALLTGKYTIRTGLQGSPIGSTQPKALPLNHTLLPEYLQELGYKTHLIGKWHLGFYKEKYTPTRRGFHSFFGYYNGWIRYNDSFTDTPINSTIYGGYDARRNLQGAEEEFKNKYVTDVYTDEAVKIIKQHDKQNPLYLQVSHTAVHAARGNLLQVKDKHKTNEEFGYIKNETRRLFAGVLKALDDSVASIISVLNETKLLSNSIILFISDNGGATSDSAWHLSNAGSNWPLRGEKMALTEGAVRGTAAIWSPFIKKSEVSNQLIHISDWLPTFYAAAGGNVDLLQNLDGVNQWRTLTSSDESSSREEILLNIDDKSNESAYIYKNWKLLQVNLAATKSIDKYSGSDDREGEYNVFDVVSSSTNHILRTFASSKSESLEREYLRLRHEAEVRCPDSTLEERNKNNLDFLDCFQTVCLFNIISDPCEQHDLSHSEPNITETLKAKIAKFIPEVVKQDDPFNDVRSDPELWGGYWTPWLPDYD